MSCETAMQWFAQDYAAKYPKAVEALFVDVLRLLPHFHCPATHWKHIQATNPIESTFVTVKLRMCVTVGAREPRD
ncbi:MAG: transposase [Nitrospira sp.]|nr:transposase [Nitrospira sp.]